MGTIDQGYLKSHFEASASGGKLNTPGRREPEGPPPATRPCLKSPFGMSESFAAAIMLRVIGVRHAERDGNFEFSNKA